MDVEKVSEIVSKKEGYDPKVTAKKSFESFIILISSLIVSFISSKIFGDTIPEEFKTEFTAALVILINSGIVAVKNYMKHKNIKLLNNDEEDKDADYELVDENKDGE